MVCYIKGKMTIGVGTSDKYYSEFEYYKFSNWEYSSNSAKKLKLLHREISSERFKKIIYIYIYVIDKILKDYI